MKDFCLSLLKADSADEVENLLQQKGYLDDLGAWRPVGDNWNNKGTVQNQQSDAISALAEKITNSIDAVLMDQCYMAGIEPEGPDAPPNFTRAVGKFFFKSEGSTLKNLAEYATATELKQLEKYIYLAATGSKNSPSLTITDKGEGQTPDLFPKTFLSLTGARETGGLLKSIKRQIPFLQGQFGMGGSGAYKYSRYQLLISKRNPKLLKDPITNRDTHWGFTVVRANESRDATGTIYEYLAPVNHSEDEEGAVLSFSSSTLPLMPESPPTTVPNKAYGQEIEYGTAVKLYEYDYSGTRSNITFSDSLRGQLELVMPRLALRVMGVEARNFNGSPGSFQTAWFGVVARLEEELKSSPEKFEGEAVKSSFKINNARISWQAFVKKEDFGTQNAKGQQALIVHLNGQKHGVKSATWLRNAKLETLARRNTILIAVDASELPKLLQEKLFMSSRDRFVTDSPFAKDFMKTLIDDLKQNDQLKAYQQAQKLREQNKTITDTKAANEFLENWLKKDPLLANFFGFGGKINTKIPTPASSGSGAGASDFEGVKFPKVLTFKNKKIEYKQSAQLGKSARVALVTDAQNDYLDRDIDFGTIRVFDLTNQVEIEDISESLYNGALNITLRKLPPGKVGEEIELQIQMSDDSMVEPLTCGLIITLIPPAASDSGSTGRRTEPNGPNGEDGGKSLLSPPGFVFVHDPKEAKRRQLQAHGRDDHGRRRELRI